MFTRYIQNHKALKGHLAIAVALASTVLFSGCQSTSNDLQRNINTLADSSSSHHDDDNHEHILEIQNKVEKIQERGMHAKAELNDAMSSMLRRSFSYQTDITVSNTNVRHSKKRNNFSQSTMEQLEKQAEIYCDTVHDKKYANLLAEFEEAGFSYQDISKGIDLVQPYSAKIEQIKQEYLSCYSQKMTWQAEHDKRDISTYYGGHQKTLDIINQVANPPEFMSEYEYMADEPKTKKQALLDSYLLRRSTSQVSGIYKPLLGRFTLLPVFSYQGRNLEASVNQPILIDLRKAEVYFWADNFAVITSEYFDETLGTKWKNKWLKVSLNDGSLPEGLTRDLLIAHIDANRLALQAQDNANFSYVQLKSTNGTDKDMLTSLDKEQSLTPSQLKQSAYVIEQKQSAEDITRSRELFYRHIYTSMATKYPTFLEEKSSADSYPNRLNAKILVGNYLNLVKEFADISDMEVKEESSNIEDTSNIRVIEKNKPISRLQQYGFSKSGKLLWWRTQINLPSIDKDKSNELGGVITSFTQFSPTAFGSVAYPNLPAQAQIPNEKNTVDVSDYSEDIIEHYKQGKGTFFGRAMIGVYIGFTNKKHTLGSLIDDDLNKSE